MDEAPVKQFFNNPLHPYTQGLLKAIPRPDEKKDRLYMIPGTVPGPKEQRMMKGCRFCDRCPHVMSRCREIRPAMTEVEKGHKTACHLYGEGTGR